MTAEQIAMTGERADLAQALAKQRHFLRFTVRDLTDEQAAQRTTASELCLGGVIKHVTGTERQWASFILEGPSAMGGWEDEGVMASWLDGPAGVAARDRRDCPAFGALGHHSRVARWRKVHGIGT
jgi:Protein of unknown function (DUF664)